MTIEQLRIMHQAKPFTPFEMFLADGRALRVIHPENMAYAGAGRTVAVFNEEQVAEIIDVLMITSLKPFSASISKN